MGFYQVHRDGSATKLTTCKEVDKAGKKIGKDGEKVVFAKTPEDARVLAEKTSDTPQRLFCAHCEHTHVAFTSPETSNIVSP